MALTTGRGGKHRASAVISACLMLVMGLPACSGSLSAEVQPPKAVRSVWAQPELVAEAPLVFSDETSKSLPMIGDEDLAGACVGALYVEEPMASGIVQVSSAAEELCNDRQILCVRECDKRRPPDQGIKKGSPAHFAYCRRTCHAEYMACLKKIGAVTRVFEAFDSAWAWIKEHKGAILGTVIIIGGVAYVVSTAGSGALVLVPLLG